MRFRDPAGGNGQAWCASTPEAILARTQTTLINDSYRSTPEPEGEIPSGDPQARRNAAIGSAWPKTA